jgi:hypothetical protein
MRLIFVKKEISNLDESITLSELGLIDSSTVILVVRFHGGGSEKNIYADCIFDNTN